LLLQALSGRIQDLTITGDLMMDGLRCDPKAVSNPVAYVPQFDTLNGELTARETTRNMAKLKRNKPASVIESDVSELLEKMGLSHVCDGIIGTLIFRGLSGGQKKRAEIAAELIASPSILILDEPTSGLDSSIAFEVVQSIRDLARESKGRLSVILSIHQPNSRILSLFDHILLLERGSTIFFGTLPESMGFFERSGHPCPPAVTPTDYFLQISDSNFSFVKDTDFHHVFEQSPENIELMSIMSTLYTLCNDPKRTLVTKKTEAELELSQVSWGTQFHTLLYRDFALAYRDPTLYYFQIFLLVGFGFFTGCVFWDLPREVDGQFNLITSGLLWLTLMFCWIHAFKVFYISACDKRAVHEIANKSYSPITIVLADSVTTAVMSCCFFPVPLIAYFMMGFPGESFAFILLNCWMTSLAAEAMMATITKFSHSPTVSMVFAEAALVNLEVFGGGVFIPWDECPVWWLWLQESCVFTQSSRAAIMAVMVHLNFDCTLSADGLCHDPATQAVYACDSYYDEGTMCKVNGREMLAVTQGVGRDDNYWYYFIYLVLIFLTFKIIVTLLTYYPWDRVHYYATHTLLGSGGVSSGDANELKNASRTAQSGQGGEGKTLAGEEGEEGEEGEGEVVSALYASSGPSSVPFQAAPTVPARAAPPLPVEAATIEVAPVVEGAEVIATEPTPAAAAETEGGAEAAAAEPAPTEPIAPAAPAEGEGTAAERESVAADMKDKFKVLPPTQKKKCGRRNSFHGKGKASLTWDSLSVILPKTGKHLVDHVSGYVSSGRVLALMGSSGAGKTTLLNGLAGRADYALIEGSVRFAGRKMKKTDLTYVPQFDEVNAIMTVEEHMLLVGELTCIDKAVMVKRCADLLDVLGLTEKKDARIRDLSGGEVKRVSVGIGMISNPHVFFWTSLPLASTAPLPSALYPTW
jgi:ABC-type multidrug transport system ATPase subunit